MKHTQGLMRKAGALLSGIALASLCVAPGMAAASDAQMASEKAETVNVSTTATGQVTKVEVQTTLKNSGSADELLDFSDLYDIEGVDKATFTVSGDDIVWQASGKDVSYKGLSGKDLPISMLVTYKLGDEAVPPEAIAGKSGDVSIRFDYTNNSTFTATVNGSQVTMCTPFTCITALMLDGDSFSDVKVTNGKVISDGSDVIITGYAMPGLKDSLGSLADNADVPSYFEVTAHTTDFELKSTMTIVTAGLMSDMDVDGMGFNDLDDTSTSLSDGMAQLVSGANELTDGMNTLADGATQLGAGVDELASGAKSLTYGLYLLAYGEDGESGLQTAASSSKQLVDGLAAIDEQLAAIANDQTGLPAVAGSLDQLATAYSDPAAIAALQHAIESDAALTEEQKMQLKALVASSSELSTVSGYVTQYSNGIVALSKSYTEIVKQAKSLPEGLAQAAEAAKTLHAGSYALSNGAGELSTATSEFSDGVSEAANGSGTLAQGLDTFNKEGIAKIVDTINNDLGGLKQRLKALSNEASLYDNFAGKLDGTSSSVKFVYETAAVEAD